MKRYLALVFLLLCAPLQSEARQSAASFNTTPPPAFAGSLWQGGGVSQQGSATQQPTPLPEKVYAEPTEDEEEEDSPVGDFTITYGFDFSDRPRNNPNGSRDIVGPFAFGVTLHPRLSVEVGFDTFLSSKEPASDRVTGAGDMSLSLDFLAAEEKGSRPSLSFVYTATIPTASVEKGLGSGRVDHLALVALSNRLGKGGEHGTIGASFGPSFVGRQGESGFITTGRLTLSYRYGFANGFGYAGRVAGRSRGGGRASRASTTHTLSYDFNERYSLEGGVLAGLTSNAPRVGFFTSFTISGNFREVFK